MHKVFKSFLSKVLVVVMFFSIIPMETFSLEAYAAGNIVINGVDIGYANGGYFTKNGKTCGNNSYWKTGRCHKNGVCNETYSQHCNCMRYWPTGNRNTCKIDLGASQCFGFARYCQYIVYGYCEYGNSAYFTDITGSISSCSASNLKSKLLKCAPATHIRTKSTIKEYAHSISIVSASDNSVQVADCNSDGYCKVRLKTYSWSELATYLNSYGGISYSNSWNREIKTNTNNSSNPGLVEPIINWAKSAVYSATGTGYVSHVTSSEGVNMIKNFEGLRKTAYKDSAGVWTIGYGHTGGVYSGMTISDEKAAQYLKNDLTKFENAVNSFLKSHNRYVNQAQFDALVSFSFNVGTAWMSDSSYNIYKYVSTGNHTDEQIKETFGSWCNAGGKKVAGLVTRRSKEAALYLYGTYNGSGGSNLTSTSSSSNVSSYTPSAEYRTGIYIITTNSGMNVRSGAGTNSGVVRKLSKNTQVSVARINGNWGELSSGGWMCLDYSIRIGDNEPVINVPTAPYITTTNPSNIAVGTSVTITWGAASDATCYDVYLKDSNGNVAQSVIGATGGSVAFNIGSAGNYTVVAVSRNSKYTSSNSNTIKYTAHKPSTVNFVDWNNSVISSQTVAYGASATLPANPSRYGWTFKRWNGNYNNVTTHQTITAYYERNIYTVTFVDEKGDIIGSKQKIEFEGAATAPSYTAPEGYTFLKWDKSFNYIESNLTVSPVIVWSNEDLPVTILSATTAIRENTGYTVNVVVRNNPTKATDGRIIVALKTDTGKLLSMTESAAFHLKSSAEKTVEVFMPYDKAATKAEMYVVETFSTAIPISAVLKKDINQGTAWTNWSTSPNPSEAYQSENRQEYRYRTKSTTTSSSSSLSGWTKYDTTSAWSNYGGWSDWSDTAISSNDYRQVETRTVVSSTNYKTVYHYYRYASSEHASSGSYAYSASYPNLYSYSFDSPLSTTTALNGHTRYEWWYNGSNWHGVYASSPYTTQEVVSYNYKTQYRYRERSLNYTYYYYKWSDWSAWSTSSVTSNSNREVQNRITYRYLANDPSLVADNSGIERTITGFVDTSLAGEQAILFVYKVDEASDYTNEYVGQTIIGNDGSYRFTFKLREEPSVKTGDYTVTLGIEGTSTAIYLDKIIAPKPTYTVTYLDWDGTVLGTQIVTDGENAVPPQTNPSREGYDFICWNNTATNVKDDLTVSPVYKIKEYTVVFVDWSKESVILEKYEHGQPLVTPEIDNTDDSFAVGWDKVIDGTTKVTSDMIITAKYTKKTFTVNFLDESGEVLVSEQLNYGEAAEAPNSLENENVILHGWVTDGDMDFVVENLTVVPVYSFKDTVARPFADIASGEYEETQTVTLSCETENAVIYYSTDGSDPLESGIEYTAPIEISSSCELKYTACAFEMNDSEPNKTVLAINDTARKMHVVTIIGMGAYTIDDTFLVEDGMSTGFTAGDFEIQGYNISGIYVEKTEDECYAWNFDTDVVTESIAIIIDYDPETYEVVFIGYDDEILDIQNVEYLGEAVAPTVEGVEGYVFCGFGETDFTIKGDTTFYARFVPELEYVGVTLNKSKCRLYSGSSVTLLCTLSNPELATEEVMWCSSDESILKVDSNGTVTALKPGTAIVYATYFGTESVASCEVTVIANTDEQIILEEGNGVGFDSSGQLRGISASNNVVSEVKKFFANESLQFIDITGYELKDDDLVGTGTVVRLKNGNEVVSEKTIVVTGDMNGDGKINNRDASMVARYLVDKEVASLAQLTAIDVNGDGYINNRDASMVARYLVGKETF